MQRLHETCSPDKPRTDARQGSTNPSSLRTVRAAHGRAPGAYRRAACYVITDDGARLIAGGYVAPAADRPARRGSSTSSRQSWRDRRAA